MKPRTVQVTCLEIPSPLLGAAGKDWAPGLLWGPAGVGKSYEAFSRLNTACSGGFLNVHAYVDDVRAVELADLDDEGDRDEWRAAHELERIPFRSKPLVLDDIGVHNPSDFALRVIFDLVDKRWAGELPTLVTSNISPEALALVMGDRIASRILSFGPVKHMTGRDRRVEQVTEEAWR